MSEEQQDNEFPDALSISEALSDVVQGKCLSN